MRLTIHGFNQRGRPEMARNLPAPIVKIVGFYTDGTARVRITMPPGTDPDIEVKVLRKIEINEDSRPIRLEGSPFSSHEIDLEDTATRDHPGKVVTYLARAVRGDDDSPLCRASAVIPSLRFFKIVAIMGLVFGLLSILVSAYLLSQLKKATEKVAPVAPLVVAPPVTPTATPTVPTTSPTVTIPATAPATTAPATTRSLRTPASLPVGDDPGASTKPSSTPPTTAPSPTTVPSAPAILRFQTFIIKPVKGHEEAMRYVYLKLPGEGIEDKPSCIAAPAKFDGKENPITLILENCKKTDLAELYDKKLDPRGYKWIVQPQESKLKATFFDVQGNLKIVSAPLSVSSFPPR